MARAVNYIPDLARPSEGLRQKSKGISRKQSGYAGGLVNKATQTQSAYYEGCVRGGGGLRSSNSTGHHQGCRTILGITKVVSGAPSSWGYEFAR